MRHAARSPSTLLCSLRFVTLTSLWNLQTVTQSFRGESSSLHVFQKFVDSSLQLSLVPDGSAERKKRSQNYSKMYKKSFKRMPWTIQVASGTQVGSRRALGGSQGGAG